MLRYKEMMEVMLPCDDLVLRAAVSQRQSTDCPRSQMLNCTVERELAFLIEKEIEYHINVEKSKRELISRYDWSIGEAFAKLDCMRHSFLSY